MTTRLQIDRLEWDEWNREHAVKHGVAFGDISAALKNVLFIKPSYKSRLLVFGRENSDRIIAVVIGEVPEKPNVYYVFSARPANRRERRKLREEWNT